MVRLSLEGDRGSTSPLRVTETPVMMCSFLATPGHQPDPASSHPEVCFLVELQPPSLIPMQVSLSQGRASSNSLVSSPDFIWCLYCFQYALHTTLKAICTGAETETSIARYAPFPDWPNLRHISIQNVIMFTGLIPSPHSKAYSLFHHWSCSTELGGRGTRCHFHSNH